MDKYLLKAVNRTSHLGFQKENMIGVVIMLILSRDAFSANVDVANFISNVFGMESPGYAIRSRTLMVAKLSRHINNMDEKKLEICYRKLALVLNEIRESAYSDAKITKEKIKTNNAFINMSKWISGTGKKD